MRVFLLTVFVLPTMFAADEVQLALHLKAQTDFDRVELAAVPELQHTLACIQSQAALLPVASRVDLPLVHFRKGYCTLMGATITHAAADFNAAAAEFDAAVAAWPARVEKPPKGVPVEPVSSALPVLASIAKLQGGGDEAAAVAAIQAAVSANACPASVMPASQCAGVLQIGKQWAGWVALRANRLSEAATDFADSPGTGWPSWVAGRQAFEARKYSDAATQYRKAVDEWDRLAKESAPSLTTRLAPKSDMGLMLTDLGGAQLLAGNTSAAIATLDQAVKRDPDHAWTFYLRARAKEIAGQAEAAASDYNLAARTALAGSHDLASGEAHLYRGIMLYRRKEFAKAEDEFASALNFEIAANLRPDAVAWRYMAAVADGGCEASRAGLSKSLGAVSGYFPRKEAEELMARCSVRSSRE
jgi:tetratricopeptide (TPR) repeat protein